VESVRTLLEEFFKRLPRRKVADSVIMNGMFRSYFRICEWNICIPSRGHSPILRRSLRHISRLYVNKLHNNVSYSPIVYVLPTCSVQGCLYFQDK
jgi:hypothetical protein